MGRLDSSNGGLTKIGYLPYGENSGVSSGTFLYAGRRLDAETTGSTAEPSGLYYYRARMYSPAVGRFLQADPIGYAGGLNLYAYTDNDPLNQTDPSGKCPSCIFGAIVGGALEAAVEYHNGQLSLSWASAGKIGLAAGAGALTGGIGSLTAALGGSGVAAAITAGAVGSPVAGAVYLANSCAIDQSCNPRAAAIAMGAGLLDPTAGGTIGDAAAQLAVRSGSRSFANGINGAVQATTSGLVSGVGQETLKDAVASPDSPTSGLYISPSILTNPNSLTSGGAQFGSTDGGRT